MIELFATIDVSKNLTERIETSNSEFGNNISADKIPVGAKEYTRPFILGASTLGSGEVFSVKNEVFVGKEISDENGNFSTPYTFSFSFPDQLEYYQFVSLAFDTVGGGHPISIKVDGVDISDDDSIFNFKVQKTPNSIHTLTIENWNKPNSPLIISGIYSVIKSIIDKRNALRIEGYISQRGDFKLPSYGLYSNYGKIEFVDKTGEYEDYARFGILVDGCKTELKLRNTLDKNANESDLENIVGTYYTKNWDYDANNRKVSVSLSDNLEVLQEVQGTEFYVGGDLTMYDVYLHLKGESSPYLAFKELSYSLDSRLKSIPCPSPTLNKKSLWAQWQDFCVATTLYMFINKDGEVEFFANSKGD